MVTDKDDKALFSPKKILSLWELTNIGPLIVFSLLMVIRMVTILMDMMPMVTVMMAEVLRGIMKKEFFTGFRNNLKQIQSRSWSLIKNPSQTLFSSFYTFQHSFWPQILTISNTGPSFRRSLHLLWPMFVHGDRWSSSSSWSSSSVSQS